MSVKEKGRKLYYILKQGKTPLKFIFLGYNLIKISDAGGKKRVAIIEIREKTEGRKRKAFPPVLYLIFLRFSFPFFIFSH